MSTLEEAVAELAAYCMELTSSYATVVVAPFKPRGDSVHTCGGRACQTVFTTAPPAIQQIVRQTRIKDPSHARKRLTTLLRKELARKGYSVSDLARINEGMRGVNTKRRKRLAWRITRCS